MYVICIKMYKERLLRTFKDMIVNFIDELIVQFPNEPDLIIGRIYIKDKIEDEKLINKFILHIIPLKDLIKNRDESFLRNMPNSTNIYYEQKFNHFKTLWKSTVLDDDDKEIIWKWVDSFILLAEKYQKTM